MKLLAAALGVTLRLEVEDAGLRRLVATALTDLRPGPAGCRTEPPLDVLVSGHGPWRIHAPAHTGTAGTYGEALSQVLTAVNLTVVARTPLLAFHAAVLARGSGSLLIPGRSGLGKSTLTACLLRCGWSYVTDEALALDWETGRLSAYPRPMGLSDWSCRVADDPARLPAHEDNVVRARDLGACIERDPPPVRHVVLLDRPGGDAPLQLVPIDRNDALAELLQRGFTHHRDAGRALQLLAELLRGASVLRLTLSDPRAAAHLLTAAMSG